MWLHQCSFINTFHNISELTKTNRLRVSINNGPPTELILPDGYYNAD